jgi:hypothetical protein
MFPKASLSLALIGLISIISSPLRAEEHPAPAAPVVAAPAVTAPAVAAPVAEAPKVEAPKVETPKTETAEKTGEKTTKPVDEKRVGKMRERWKKMTPEQRDEMRKKAERRLGERYDRLKSNEQTTINGIMSEIEKLNKEQRSILMAKIRQKASNERKQRKLMKEAEAMGKKDAPKSDPNAAAHH